jgi:Fe-S-cluster containining protein
MEICFIKSSRFDTYLNQIPKSTRNEITEYIARIVAGALLGNRKAEKLLDAYAAVDFAIQDAKAPASCKKGCSSCCRIGVDASREEGELAAKYIKENKIDFPMESLELHKDLKLLEHYELPPDKSRCAFLKDDVCQIYPVRPFACRTMLVKSPPEWCGDIRFDKTQQLVVTKAEIIKSIFQSISATKHKRDPQRTFFWWVHYYLTKE